MEHMNNTQINTGMESLAQNTQAMQSVQPKNTVQKSGKPKKKRHSGRYQDRKAKKDARVGNEYETVPADFCLSAIKTLSGKVPAKYRECYVIPMNNMLKQVKALTHAANRHYMHGQNEKRPFSREFLALNAETMLRDFQTRHDMLSKASDILNEFDSLFDDLMGLCDLEKSERTRIRKIIRRIAEEEAARAGSQAAADGKALVPIRFDIREIRFLAETESGRAVSRIGLTVSQRDRILEKERNAKAEIRARMSNDERSMKTLKRIIAQQTGVSRAAEPNIQSAPAFTSAG